MIGWIFIVLVHLNK